MNIYFIRYNNECKYVINNWPVLFCEELQLRMLAARVIVCVVGQHAMSLSLQNGSVSHVHETQFGLWKLTCGVIRCITWIQRLQLRYSKHSVRLGCAVDLLCHLSQENIDILQHFTHLFLLTFSRRLLDYSCC